MDWYLVPGTRDKNLTALTQDKTTQDKTTQDKMESYFTNIKISIRHRRYNDISAYTAQLFQFYSNSGFPAPHTKFYTFMIKLMEWYRYNRHRGGLFTRKSANREISNILINLYEHYSSRVIYKPFYKFIRELRILNTGDETEGGGGDEDYPRAWNAWRFPERLRRSNIVNTPVYLLSESVSEELTRLLLHDKRSVCLI